MLTEMNYELESLSGPTSQANSRSTNNHSQKHQPIMSSSTIENSGSQTIGSSGSFFWGFGSSKPHYAYEYYYDSSVVSKTSQAAVVILFVVGTSMSCAAYSDLAANCVSGQSTVWVTVDNSPGNMVKLNAGKTADAFNDIKNNITERLGDTVSSNPAIFVGGHSAGGFSAIAALQENEGIVDKGGKLGFKPAGCIAADPLGRTVQIPSLTIECPTFAMGFTVETCFVILDQAGLAAYNTTTNKNRVMMQMVNKRDFGNQITHCIFSSDGCTACPSHQAGAWTRPVTGKFAILFVDSVVKGESATKAQYVEATGGYSSLVNVFVGDEVATTKD
eukprot:scaffold1153_cov147-Skeletonema_menzelii.AAC.4